MTDSKVAQRCVEACIVCQVSPVDPVASYVNGGSFIANLLYPFLKFPSQRPLNGLRRFHLR